MKTDNGKKEITKIILIICLGIMIMLLNPSFIVIVIRLAFSLAVLGVAFDIITGIAYIASKAMQKLKKLIK